MKQITTEELRIWQRERKNFLLIDVRESFERDAFDIGGIHISMDEVMKKMNELKNAYAGVPIVFYCEKGIRSSLVIQRLEQLNFENLYNLSGGINAWKKRHEK